MSLDELRNNVIKSALLCTKELFSIHDQISSAVPLCNHDRADIISLGYQTMFCFAGSRLQRAIVIVSAK